MGLKKKTEPQDSNKAVLKEKRQTGRDYAGLLTELDSRDPMKRRWAARDLAAWPEAVEALLAALPRENEHPVREAIFDSLSSIGGEDVVAGLIPLLRSEDAALRNGAIEVLQSMPADVAPHIIELLNDRDSDVRIFAIDILQQLAHPRTPEWLLSVLKDESHVNVVATAVDRLAEVGTPDMLPDLQAIKQRFPDEPYLGFAVDMVIRRIEEG